MIIYIDENFPSQLADGLNILVQHPYPLLEVKSIRKTFGEGAKDHEWIPLAGKQGAIAITQDLNIHRLRNQMELFMANGLGVFFFKPPSKNGYTYWEMVEQILKRWRRIVEIAEKSTKPFAYTCQSRSG